MLTIYHCAVQYQWFDGTPSVTEDYVLSETEVGAKVMFFLWHSPGFKELGVNLHQITAQPVAHNVPLIFDANGLLIKPVADKALYDYVERSRNLVH